jgi:hypothetical protein
VLLTLVVCCWGVSTVVADDGVRFTASPGVVQMRVEVVSSSGATLYDSDWRSGNVFDWSTPTLPYGSYAVRIFTKDLQGRTLEKQTTLRVDPDRMSIDSPAGSDLKLTTTLHNGETGQLVTTSGDLSFRFGDFLNRKDTEVMRLTAAGNLDVHGLIRTGEGILFPDGSIQRSAVIPSVVRMRPSNPQSDKKLTPKSEISGAGTTNQITKWADGPGGVVGDSTITEVGGKVGIGTTGPGAQLHIYGASNLDLFAGMGPDVISGPGFNYGYAGNSFGVGAGFFNVRPATGATGVNPSLRFMTVDTERMIVTNAGDVGIGTSAPSQKLHVVGNVTLSGDLVLPATTSQNVGVIMLGGFGNRFAHNFGLNNTFLGQNAGNFTMTGDANTVIGRAALQSNTTGLQNTATGALVLFNNTTGNNNTASGAFALNLNTSGGANTAGGLNALFNNTTGNNNTAFGIGALYNNTIGGGNIAVGALAGQNLNTGNSNIYIGNQGASVDYNTIRIGDSPSQTKAFIAGISGVTTGGAAIAVVIDANGQLGTVSSSGRYKFDVSDMAEATAGLMFLRPVTFRYLAHGDSAPLQYGLIAEEVAEVYPELVARNKDGEVETVMYQFLAPMLLNEVQREHRWNEEQQKTIDRLEQRLQALETQLANSLQ